MKTIGNIIWIIFGGLGGALAFLLAGLVWCITIIGIPFGLQAFKMAGLVLAPFGKTVNTNFGAHPIDNILWLLITGLVMALGYIFMGVVFCITIIGIPFGKQCFKLASLSAVPFGATVS